MALKATIFKADLQVADMDHHYYGDHALTIARHPSETDERMMIRLLAFALNADPALAFGRGLSTEDEPDLWRKDLTGAIEQWIEVGLPDERRLLKACARAGEVVVYAYGVIVPWWKQLGPRLARAANLRVHALDAAACAGLKALVQRTMKLQATIQDGQVWLSDGERSLTLEPAVLQGR